MKKLALIALVCAGCGGEAFEPELFQKPTPTCDGASYLRLDGGRVRLSDGPLRPPIAVSYELRLSGTDPAVRVARDGPEVPCGWSLSVNGGELNAAIVGHVNHVAPFRFVDTGWHAVAWNYDGETSSLMVDGKFVSSEPKSSASWPWPACSDPAFASGGGDVNDVSFGGVKAEYGDIIGSAEMKSACQ